MPRRTEDKFLLALWMGNGLAYTPSRTRDHQYHATDLNKKTCSCEDNQLNGAECWHLKTLKDVYQSTQCAHLQS